MAERPEIQYTIRGVPEEVDRVLRRRAESLGRSLNQQVLEELTRAAAGPGPRADFSDPVGRWTPDPAFDEIVGSCRQIDRDKWI
jgi:hypothetical protein